MLTGKTKRFRHFLVKLIAPKLYYTAYAHVSGTRPMTQFINKNLSGSLTGVEIGVAAGQNALNILETLNIQKLFLIDPYEPYVECGETFHPEDRLAVALRRLDAYKDKIHFKKMKSEDAADSIPKDLDFVYIDGNHAYDFVKKDIESYYPKVRIGGVIGGHDYGFVHDVKRAVDEFAKTQRLHLHVEQVDWWVVKK